MSPRPLATALSALVSPTLSISTVRLLVLRIATLKWLWSNTFVPFTSIVPCGSNFGTGGSRLVLLAF
jgi:hypothetical protein